MSHVSTRLLLTCAAIGVAGALLYVGNSYVDILIAATVPALYGVLIGVYFIPVVIAQALLRRGGVGLLTGLVAGLVSGAVTPHLFLTYVGVGAGIGALMEIPFLVARYRYWRAWVFYVAAAAVGVLMGVGVFIGVGLEKYEGWLAVVYFAGFTLSPLIGTWIGRLIAAGVDRTGVARGVQREVDTRTPRRSVTSDAS